MRNADLDDLKDEQYAEQVRQERKEVDAMPKTQTTPEAVIGDEAVKRLNIAGFDIVRRPVPKRVRHRYTCPMCAYSEFGGMALDAFADWGEVWHRACVSPYEVSPSKRGDNLPMIHTEEAA